MGSIPHEHIRETGITELIGINEQVDQNDYAGSVAIAIENGPRSGVLTRFLLLSTEDGSGAILKPSGNLLVMDADPNVSAGDTAITAAEWATVIGVVKVEAGDWLTDDANGTVAYIMDTEIPFHNLSTLYLLWDHTLTTSYNDGAGDDEQLEINIWYEVWS